MTTLVSRNTIKLASNASSNSNYYKGYTILVSRLDPTTGKETVQKKQIVAYDGASKVATIDGIWDLTFIPGASDTYRIVPTYTDSRVSINSAIQTLDYITSVRYGKGLNPISDLRLDTWLESARTCDTRSDVTVQVTNSTGVVVGAVYRYINGVMHFQGAVKSVSGSYIRFTNVLGKLANKWNSWKTLPAGALVYDENRLYITDGGVKTTRPVHSGGTVDGLNFVSSGANLTRTSGTGPTTLTTVSDGNPVRAVAANGSRISGYSLYDADGIDYWRYVGWDEHAQRYVTRHQTNLVVDTSLPLLDNINSLLDHFGGILRYAEGKYSLEIEEGEGQIAVTDNEIRNITSDHIIGTIRVTDEGIRSSYNSLTVAYADPGNKFEAKNISFFNSTFLQADRNVPKKGNLSIPGITNYYNARLLADKFLVKSRYGMTVSFNMAPRGVLLLAGKVIQLQHPRYNWVNKRFRIENITHIEDGTVDIVAKEYDDSFYVINSISRPPAAALAAESNNKTDIAPTGLTATSLESENEAVGGIELNWANSPRADTTSVDTEIFSSKNSHLFILGDSISANVVHTPVPHNLSPKDTVTSNAGTNGLSFGTTYFVKEVIDANRFTLAIAPDAAQIDYLTDGDQLQLKLLTANIIATVSPPGTSYIDVIPGTGIDRIQKYYWIRHKITQV